MHNIYVNIMYIIPVNGLLNRIRSILSAKIIADSLNEKLTVIWIPEKCCNCKYEHIFGDNSLLWDNIPLNEISHFEKKNNIKINAIPLYYNEDNNIATLRGHDRGEQCFIKKFLESSCSFKLIYAGGNFYPHYMSKQNFNIKKNNIYSQIKYNSLIEKNVKPKLPDTLGIHLRYTDRSYFAPSLENILVTVNDIIKSNNISNIFIISDEFTKKTTLYDLLKNKYNNINIELSEVKDTTRNNPVNLQNAIVDWISLCQCQNILFFTGSSFGYEAYVASLYKNVSVFEIPDKNLLL